MNPDGGVPLEVVLLVLVPLTVVWVVTLVDIVRQPQMRTRRKVAWVTACTLLWPAQVLYLLVRPQRGRAEWAVDRDDPHERLVDAVLDREDGRIDADRFARIVAELRGRDAGR